MIDKLERDLAQVAADLEIPPPEPGSRNKGVRKVVKKVTKVKPSAKPVKEAKTNGKAEAPAESEEGKVTLATLAAEAEITPAGARRKLRNAEGIERGEGRWVWEEGSKALAAVRKVLGLDAAA